MHTVKVLDKSDKAVLPLSLSCDHCVVIGDEQVVVIAPFIATDCLIQNACKAF